jgi:Protein of unknown function (DUF742)
LKPPEERWKAEDPGPLVRLYALTRGRTRPRAGRFDLVTLLIATWNPVTAQMGLSREHHQLRALCREPAAVADLASELDLPVTIVQILLEDLCDHGLLQEVPTQSQLPAIYNVPLLQNVLQGLRDL